MTDKKYSIILSDPPWKFKVWRDAGKGRTAATYYPTMPTEQICALPVQDLAAPDCVLFLWAVWPHLPDALEVIRSWGFEYKTVGFVWVKQTRASFGLHMGMGYWTRANTEPCLLATRGNPRRVNKAVRQVVLSPVRQHSRKPDEVHHKIVDLMGDLPRIELFARRPFSGWSVWGNEVESDVELAG